MEGEILFSEKQQFRQWWLWVLMLGITAYSLYFSFQSIIAITSGTVETDRLIGMMIAIVAPLLPMVLFLVIKLETQITQQGISVRFFPLQTKYKFFAWDSLTKCYVREYSALSEYGGWGLRMGLLGGGRAYNVSGNKGLQLVTSNGKKVLIGTIKPEQVTEVLISMGQLKE